MYAEYPWLIMGDFKCRIGNLGDVSIEQLQGIGLMASRSSKDLKVDSRGTKLINFMSCHDFLALNGRSMSDNPGEFTFCSQLGVSTNDFSFANSCSLPYILDFKVYNDYLIGDHFPICTKIKTIETVFERSENGMQIASARVPYIKWNPNYFNLFQRAMLFSNKISVNDLHDIDGTYNNFCTAVYEISESLGMSFSRNLGFNVKRTSVLQKIHGMMTKTLKENNFSPTYRRQLIDFKKTYSVTIKNNKRTSKKYGF